MTKLFVLFTIYMILSIVKFSSVTSSYGSDKGLVSNRSRLRIEKTRLLQDSSTEVNSTTTSGGDTDAPTDPSVSADADVPEAEDAGDDDKEGDDADDVTPADGKDDDAEGDDDVAGKEEEAEEEEEEEEEDKEAVDGSVSYDDDGGYANNSTNATDSTYSDSEETYGSDLEDDDTELDDVDAFINGTKGSDYDDHDLDDYVDDSHRVKHPRMSTGTIVVYMFVTLVLLVAFGYIVTSVFFTPRKPGYSQISDETEKKKLLGDDTDLPF